MKEPWHNVWDRFNPQRKNKPKDFSDAHVFGSQPKNERMGVDDLIEKIIDLNIKDMSATVRGVSDQGSLAWELFTPDILRSRVISPKQNYVEFHQRYTGILDEVKHEAEQARLLDSDIIEIKNKAYDEFDVIMEEIYNAGVSMPEVTWNEDGSLDIGWPLKTGGTSTILVYGDDHVIYNTYLGPDNYVESICKISDGLLLPKLIGILSNITE